MSRRTLEVISWCCDGSIVTIQDEVVRTIRLESGVFEEEWEVGESEGSFSGD